MALAVVACAGCDVVYGLTGRSDAAVELDAMDATADGGPTSPCNGIAMLDDTFDADNLAARWARNPVSAISVANGNLALVPVPDVYVTLDSVTYYDVRDQTFSAKITDDAVVSGDAYIYFALMSATPGLNVSFQEFDGQLRFRVVEGGTPYDLPAIPYDRAQHLHWRFAFAQGQVRFETSADGATWILQGSRPVPDFGFARVMVQTYRKSSDAAFTVLVDEIGAGARQGAVACPFVQLRDEFSTGALDANMWGRSTANSGTISVGAGDAMLLTQGGAGNAVVTLRSAQVYDLTNSELAFEVPQMVMPAPTKEFEVAIRVLGGEYLSIGQVGGMVFGRTLRLSMTSTLFSVPYVESAMRWWRLRNASGLTHWEVSPDGRTWSSLVTTGAIVGFDRATVEMQLTSTATDEDVVRIDNVNVLPPP